MCLNDILLLVVSNEVYLSILNFIRVRQFLRNLI